MENITYREMIARYGEPLAYDLLLSLERAANIRETLVDFDEQTRLERALELLKSDAA